MPRKAEFTEYQEVDEPEQFAKLYADPTVLDKNEYRELHTWLFDNKRFILNMEQAQLRSNTKLRLPFAIRLEEIQADLVLSQPQGDAETSSNPASESTKHVIELLERLIHTLNNETKMRYHARHHEMPPPTVEYTCVKCENTLRLRPKDDLRCYWCGIECQAGAPGIVRKVRG